MSRDRHGERRAAGFTLTEALIASAILAIAVAAAALPFSASLMGSQRAADQGQAVRLAEAMLEEVLARPFHDPDGASTPGPEAGEDAARRFATFDNVDDYHGLVEPAGRLGDAEGRVLCNDQIALLTRWVTVTYVRMPEQPAGSPDAFVVVEVMVSNGKEELARVTRLVADEG